MVAVVVEEHGFGDVAVAVVLEEHGFGEGEEVEKGAIAIERATPKKGERRDDVAVAGEIIAACAALVVVVVRHAVQIFLLPGKENGFRPVNGEFLCNCARVGRLGSTALNRVPNARSRQIFDIVVMPAVHRI